MRPLKLKMCGKTFTKSQMFKWVFKSKVTFSLEKRRLGPVTSLGIFDGKSSRLCIIRCISIVKQKNKFEERQQGGESTAASSSPKPLDFLRGKALDYVTLLSLTPPSTCPTNGTAPLNKRYAQPTNFISLPTSSTEIPTYHFLWNAHSSIN